MSDALESVLRDLFESHLDHRVALSRVESTAAEEEEEGRARAREALGGLRRELDAIEEKNRGEFHKKYISILLHFYISTFLHFYISTFLHFLLFYISTFLHLWQSCLLQSHLPLRHPGAKYTKIK